MAIARILAHTKDYHLPQPTAANKPYLALVDIKTQLDLKKAAELAQIPLQELLQLNAGLNRWCTPPHGPHYLLIPKEKKARFEEKLATLPLNERLTWRRHKITAGENLGLIALKYHTSVKAIREVNRLSGSLIRTGKFLLIPTGQNSKYNSYAATARSFKNHNTVKKTTVYTVKTNDNLWLIAQKFSTQSTKIAQLNHLKKTTYLQPGQKLRIPQNKKNTLSKRLSLGRALQKFITLSAEVIHYRASRRNSMFQLATSANGISLATISNRVRN